MKKRCLSFFLSILVFTINAQSLNVELQSPASDRQIIDELFRQALTESKAYPWLEHLCLKIGHRLSGSPQAALAVEYSAKIMAEIGLEVTKQEVMVPHWVRGEKEVAFFAAGNGEKMMVNVTALGGSISTGDEGILAEIIEVQDWSELEQLGRENIEGKIVFFNEKMNPENLYTFESYGHCVKHRWGGAVEAARYGAKAAIVRSLNLRLDDFPHTGSMKYEDGVDRIPAAAISTKHAEALSAAIASGSQVQFYFRQTSQSLPDVLSYNVIGEIKGTKFPNEIILVGGHLDSWDVGHGAHDDGAGVMQSLAALELLKKINYKPERTIRVVFFMNEENGLRGGKKYAEVAAAKGENHIAAIESDRGGFTPRGFHVEGNSEALEKIRAWKDILEPFGLHQLTEGHGGADIGPLKTDDNVLIGFVPDSQRYFDHHHSNNDTFDTVNKRELELGAASISALVFLLDKYGI